MAEPLAHKVRSARYAARLTRSQAARRAGLSTSTLCRIEGGAHVPLLSTITALAPALGTTVADLTDDR